MPLWIVRSAGSGSDDPLEPAALELALHAQACRPACTSMMIVACGMPSVLGEDDADLAEALIVGLQTGEHEVELLVADGVGERGRDGERISRRQRVRLDVDRAVGAPRQRFADDLSRARRAGGARRPLPRCASP